jgi:hypothetical protein
MSAPVTVARSTARAARKIRQISDYAHWMTSNKSALRKSIIMASGLGELRV